MRTFRCLFEIPHTSFAIDNPYAHAPARWEITLEQPDGSPPAEVAIEDRKEIVDGSPLHRGFSARVDLHSADLDSAFRAAEAHLQMLLSIATLQCNATVGDALPLLIYETTAGADRTEFLQFDYLQGDLLLRKRALVHDEFNRLMGASLQVNNDRVARAIRWYRKGLMEDDGFDRFTSYWIGLENINKPLIAQLGERSEYGTCRSCGAPYELPTSKGIRALFEQHSANGQADFKRCRDLRVDVVHGSGALGSAVTQVAECAELCRIMLRTGIFVLLGLPAQDAKVEAQPIYNVKLPHLEYRGAFAIAPAQLPDAPFLQTKAVAAQVRDEGERRTISFTVNTASTVPAPV